MWRWKNSSRRTSFFPGSLWGNFRPVTGSVDVTGSSSSSVQTSCQSNVSPAAVFHLCPRELRVFWCLSLQPTIIVIIDWLLINLTIIFSVNTQNKLTYKSNIFCFLPGKKGIFWYFWVKMMENDYWLFKVTEWFSFLLDQSEIGTDSIINYLISLFSNVWFYLLNFADFTFKVWLGPEFLSLY